MRRDTCVQKNREHGSRDGRTVHLALIREDDLPTATWRVDGQGLLEALFDVRAPHALSIILKWFVKSISQLLTPTPWGGSRHPLRRRGGTTSRRPQSKRSGWLELCSWQQWKEKEEASAGRTPPCTKSTDVTKTMKWGLDMTEKEK